jgi:hypothetical protein
MTTTPTKPVDRVDAVYAAQARGHIVAHNPQPGSPHAWRWTCKCGDSVFFTAGKIHGPAADNVCPNPTTMDTVIYLATCQFSWGGLIDGVAVDDLLHLVRGTLRGTPGDTLCGIDRFAVDAPGFNICGGITKHGQTHTPCPGCVTVGRGLYPGVPAAGLTQNCDFETALGVPSGDAHDLRSVHYADTGDAA